MSGNFYPMDKQFGGRDPCFKSLCGTCPNDPKACDKGPHPNYQDHKFVCSFYQDKERVCTYGAKCLGWHIGIGEKRA